MKVGCYLVLAIASTAMGTTIVNYDPATGVLSQSTTVSTDGPKKWIGREFVTNSFSYTLQFTGLDQILLPGEPGPFFYLDVPVYEAVSYRVGPDTAKACVWFPSGEGMPGCVGGTFTNPYPGDVSGLVKVETWSRRSQFPQFTLNFSLETDAFAQTKTVAWGPGWEDTTASAYASVDLGHIIVLDRFGNNVRSQVSYEIVQVTPEPETWTLAAVGISLLSLVRRRTLWRRAGRSS